MIEALKRKLVETANNLDTTRDRLRSITAELEVEKREHQLTTSKLMSLLRKRSAQTLTVETSSGGAVDVSFLHQQIGLLQQQLLCTQEQERELREQYEKLRLMTLEGFRVQREVLAAEKQKEAAEEACPPLSTSPSSEGTTEPTVELSTPLVTERSPPAAVLEAVKMALQAPASRDSSNLERCASVWRRPAEHAEPRVGMVRSRSDLAMYGSNVHMSRSASERQWHPIRSAKLLAEHVGEVGSMAGQTLAASLKPTEILSPSLGYAQGAICIEPPKRQRTVTTVLHSPRLSL